MHTSFSILADEGWALHVVSSTGGHSTRGAPHGDALRRNQALLPSSYVDVRSILMVVLHSSPTGIVFTVADEGQATKFILEPTSGGASATEG